MTLSYWNSQFQFTKLLPDFQDCLTRMTARSDALWLDLRTISYGPDARQVIEMMGTPDAGTVLPVFIHGGYWRALTASVHRYVLPRLAGQAGAVANLEYRLLPDVTLAEIIEDALTGLSLIAAQTGCRLVVVGHSAGGHLAIMSALRLPDIVVGAVGVSGIYDLTPLQWSFLREEVGLEAHDLVGHSPQENWNTPDASHVLLAIGDAETPEFHRQAQQFATTHGARVITVPDCHHMTVLDVLADPKSGLSHEIQTFIQSTNIGRSSTSGS
ncbi:MAG: alpha/beta hydrolase [Pseudomonadota bacterium]